jgi:hypothetical protein
LTARHVEARCLESGNLLGMTEFHRRPGK